MNTNDLYVIKKSVTDSINTLLKEISEPKNDKEYLHHIRVSIKHIRAWLILLDTGYKQKKFKLIEKNLHNISKALSKNRDAQVVSDILSFIIKNSISKTDKTETNRFQYQLKKEIAPINWNKIQLQISEELYEFKLMHNLTYSKKNIKRGLLNSYDRIIKHGDNAFSKKKNYKKLHKLRKWVKHLYYQLCYIHEAFPENTMQIKNELDSLGDSLGHLHDLFESKNKISHLSSQHKILDHLLQKEMDKTYKKSKKCYKSIILNYQRSILSSL